MIQKDYDTLSGHIKNIHAEIELMAQSLISILKRSDKNISVNFMGKIYHFHPVFTKKESKRLDKDISHFVNRLIKKSIKDYAMFYPAYERAFKNVLAFSMGEDPKEHKFEKINILDTYKVDSIYKNESGVSAIPLNMDNYQVKQQKEESV